MPENSHQTRIVFRGAERWTRILGGVGLGLIGIIPLTDAQPEVGSVAIMWAVVLAVWGLIGIIGAIRNWRRPYVVFDGDSLIISGQFRPQYLHRKSIQSFTTNWWGTMLKMSDGGKIRISHLPFVTTNEAYKFLSQLTRFLEEPSTQTPGTASRNPDTDYGPSPKSTQGFRPTLPSGHYSKKGLTMIQSAIPVISVTDSIRAEDYYCRVLGFQPMFAYRPAPEANDPCYLGVARDGVILHLHSFKPERAGKTDAFLWVDDVDPFHAEISQRGAICQLPPTDQTWGNRETHIRDPDGNVLCFAMAGRKPADS